MAGWFSSKGRSLRCPHQTKRCGRASRDPAGLWTPPTDVDIYTSPRVAARLKVTARSRYTTDGRFGPDWEDLGYTGYQLRAVLTQPEPWRVGVVLLLWLLICLPTMIRRWRDRRGEAA